MARAPSMSSGSDWVAVVMAAGRGTRMRSAQPKVTHALAGRPIVTHVIDAARLAGASRVVVVVGADAQADAVRGAAGDDVCFAVQQRALGTADAVQTAQSACGDSRYVLIMNGDVPLVLPSTLHGLMETVEDAPAPLALLTAVVPVEAYGVLELEDGVVQRIVETKGRHAMDASALRPINSGQYAVRADWLWAHLSDIAPAPNGERYLTQLAEIAAQEGTPAIAFFAADPSEVRGTNDRVQLAEAEATLRDRIRRAHMLAGVTMTDPATVYIDADVRIGADTTIEPNTHLRGNTVIGERCVIGPGSFVRDSVIADDCIVRFSMLEEATLEAVVDVGPYSHLRPGSYICAGVHIGNFAELKASRVGPDTKIGHFSYVGDADVGADVNIGAGTITANFDGVAKHRTTIGDGAFIGSDTMLVAPVRIGRGAGTSAGSVVTKDVPDGMMALGAPARNRARGRTDEGKEPSPE